MIVPRSSLKLTFHRITRQELAHSWGDGFLMKIECESVKLFLAIHSYHRAFFFVREKAPDTNWQESCLVLARRWKSKKLEKKIYQSFSSGSWLPVVSPESKFVSFKPLIIIRLNDRLEASLDWNQPHPGLSPSHWKSSLFYLISSIVLIKTAVFFNNFATRPSTSEV